MFKVGDIVARLGGAYKGRRGTVVSVHKNSIKIAWIDDNPCNGKLAADCPIYWYGAEDFELYTPKHTLVKVHYRLSLDLHAI